MPRADLRLVRCLRSLQEPQFEPLLQYLRSMRGETLENLVGAAEPARIHVMQGRAQVLKEVLDMVEKSAELEKKLQR